MQVINLAARNNQDFKLTLPMTAWIAAGYDLGPLSKIIMEARKTAIDVTVPLVWSNQASATSPGTITLEGQDLVFRMPVAAIAREVPAAVNLVYDARILTADGRTVTMFGGALTFAQGVTR